MQSRGSTYFDRRTWCRGVWRWVGLALTCLALPSVAPRAHASCNQIPGVLNTFRGAQASLSRPFASPGDPVEIRLSPLCDAGRSFDADPAPNVVSVVFTPPNGPASLVVVANECDSLQSQLDACRTRADVAVARCVAGGIETFGPARLRFLFPDTDALVDAPDDDRTLTGPATIAVTAADAPLPCDLATRPCAGRTDLRACVDALFTIDGTCGTTADPTFGHFTALPPANDYQALCSDPAPPCTGRATELRFTIDADGNILLPMDWRGVLVGENVPVARLLRASTPIAAFPNSSEPIQIPNRAFLHSFSPEGGVLPPIFEPQVDPSGAQEMVLFGSADAPRTVLRLARRSDDLTACQGGSRDRLPCSAVADCPDGTCGPATCVDGSEPGLDCHRDTECAAGTCGTGLFDFRTRLRNGVGPVVVGRFGGGVCQDTGRPCTADTDCGDSRCVAYRAVAQDPVALDGLLESPDVFVSVVPEAIVGKDLNGDGDQTDEVLLLSDPRTGVRQPIGVAGSPGRATTRIHEAPFSYPAAAVDGDLVAFLEAEPLQGNVDSNGDGDTFDTILRVMRRGTGSAVDLAAGRILVADAAPMINGQSLVIANRHVYFRTAEAALARARLTRVSVTSRAGEADGRSRHPALSADGHHVAFESDAANLVQTDVLTSDALTPALSRGERGTEGGGAQAAPLTTYLHDLRSGATTRLPLEYDQVAPDAPAVSPTLSGDGRHLAVSAPDSLGRKQIWGIDRDADGNGVFDEPDGVTTVPMSTIPGGHPTLGKGDSVAPLLTAEGRFMTFNSNAPNLTLDGGNRTANTFVHRRDTDGNWIMDELHKQSTESATSHGDTYYGNADSVLQPAPLSADGRFVAYASYSRNIVADDTNNYCLNFFPDEQTSSNCVDVFLWDYDDSNHPQRVSRGAHGEEGNQGSLTPTMSRDATDVAFQSFATNLVPGDTNGTMDVFVRSFTDPMHFLSVPYGWSLNFRPRLRQSTTRISVSSSGDQANGSSFDRTLAMSANGRYVAFASSASNLVPGDTNAACDNDLDGVADENCYDVFVHDQVTGFTRRLSTAADGAQGNGRSSSPSMSADGQTVAFQSRASNLVAGDTNTGCTPSPAGGPYENCSDVFVVQPDPAALSTADLNGDGDLEDTVLHVFEPASGAMRALGEAEQVAVAGEVVAFLRPNPAGPNARVPTGSRLPGDGDPVDLDVYLSVRGAAPQSLGRTARALALSDRWLAALVPEPDVPGGDLNGDGDTTDSVLQVHAIGDAPGAWTNVGQAGDSVQVRGALVAFTTPELTYDFDIGVNPVEFTGEGEPFDRILQVYDADLRTVLPVRDAAGLYLSAADYLLGDHLVAFRSREQGRPKADCDLNGDGDCTDSVLLVYDVRAQRLINTCEAVIPCPLEACDPRQPYRVLKNTVTFLTLESEQGQDLDGDGQQTHLVLQTFNVASVRGTPPPARFNDCARLRAEPRRLRRGGAAAVPASTIITVGAVSTGICTTSGAPCVVAADCGPGGQCFLPPGGCVLELGTGCDPTAPVNACGNDGFCQPSRDKPGNGTCQIRQGNCGSDAACTPPARCTDAAQEIQRLINPLRAPGGGHLFVGPGETSGLVVATAADSDGDELADPFDNCPRVANPAQEDRNGNGVGDACEASPVTPSPTRAASPTPPPTPTSPPSPTLTPTLQPTVTPAPPTRSDDDGCAITPQPRAGTWALWPVLVAAAIRRARRRQRSSPGPRPRDWRVSRGDAPLDGHVSGKGGFTRFLSAALTGLALFAAPTAADTTAPCAGDCDGDGVVTVAELVTGVNVALETQPVTTCIALDAAGDGTVTVDDLVTATTNALEGCLDTVPDAAPAVATTLLRALADFAPTLLITLNSANNFSGDAGAAALSADGGAAGPVSDCPLGGIEQRTCEELDDGLVAIPIRVDGCTYAADDKVVRVSGAITLRGAGFCPGVFLPANVRLDYEMDVTISDTTGTVQRTAVFDLHGILRELTVSQTACGVRGLSLLVDGTAAVANAGGLSARFALHDTQMQANFVPVGRVCKPALGRLRLHGNVELRDGDSAAAVAVPVSLADVGVVFNPVLGDQLDIDGQFGAACMGGAVHLATRTALRPGATGCPTGGPLRLSTRDATTDVSFLPDGGVTVDHGADGSSDAHYDSCRQLSSCTAASSP